MSIIAKKKNAWGKLKPEYLRYLRQMKNWSQVELAAILECSVVQLSKWENGINAPGRRTHRILCALLDKTGWPEV